MGKMDKISIHCEDWFKPVFIVFLFFTAIILITNGFRMFDQVLFEDQHNYKNCLKVCELPYININSEIINPSSCVKECNEMLKSSCGWGVWE